MKKCVAVLLSTALLITAVVMGVFTIPVSAQDGYDGICYFEYCDACDGDGCFFEANCNECLDYWNLGSYRCYDCGRYFPDCVVCQGTGKIYVHAYNYVCDSVCYSCGYVRDDAEPHDYTDATCTTPKTCTICGATEGSALDHDYTAATCTKAQTCKLCGATSGSKLGHSYNKVVTKATTSKDGTIKNVCTRCNYTASKVTTIYKASKVSLSKTSYTYNGKVQKPTVTAKDSAGNTISSSNYTVTYASGCKNAGTYKVTVKFKGNYSGTKTLTYKINKASSSAVTVKFNKTVLAYNGKAQVPTLTLKNSSGVALKKNTDYTVTLPSGRKNIGKYTVKITFKGNYTGTKSVSYTIAPTDKSELTAYVGGTLNIGAKSNKTISYSSSNSNVAKVSSKGVITAVKAGTATVTVKSGSVSRKITVKISKPSVTISAPKTSMYIGTTMKLTAKVKPSGVKVTWSVSNKKLASITSSGTLKAKAEGTVTVNAKITYKGKTYTDTQKVKISVEYPDVSIFIAEKTDYSSAYGFNITNNSSGKIKVLAKGTVYCDGHTESIDSLYIGDGGFYSSVTMTTGSSTMVVSLDNKMLFWKGDTVYFSIYLEYNGETFIAKCRTSKYGLNKCYELTWLKD